MVRYPVQPSAFAFICFLGHAGLSDPYCKVSVVYTPSKADTTSVRTVSSAYLPTVASAGQVKRSNSFFSCIGGRCTPNECAIDLQHGLLSAPKSKPKTPTTARRPRSNSRRLSADRSYTIGSERSKPLTTVTFRTEIRPKTVDPEWNEHFEL